MKLAILRNQVSDNQLWRWSGRVHMKRVSERDPMLDSNDSELIHQFRLNWRGRIKTVEEIKDDLNLDYWRKWRYL